MMQVGFGVLDGPPTLRFAHVTTDLQQRPTRLMLVTYRCLNCDQTTRSAVADGGLHCAHCGTVVRVREGAIEGGELRRCLVCPCTQLFVRKDFSQRLGITIIVLGFIASSIALAWHHSLISLAILISTAAVDAVLYLITGNVLSCYRCHSEYRDVPGIEKHAAFQLEVHERFRQQAARMAEAHAAAGPITHDAARSTEP